MPLKSREQGDDGFWIAQVGYGVGNGIVVFETELTELTVLTLL